MAGFMFGARDAKCNPCCAQTYMFALKNWKRELSEYNLDGGYWVPWSGYVFSAGGDLRDLSSEWQEMVSYKTPTFGTQNINAFAGRLHHVDKISLTMKRDAGTVYLRFLLRVVPFGSLPLPGGNIFFPDYPTTDVTASFSMPASRFDSELMDLSRRSGKTVFTDAESFEAESGGPFGEMTIDDCGDVAIGWNLPGVDTTGRTISFRYSSYPSESYDGYGSTNDACSWVWTENEVEFLILGENAGFTCCISKAGHGDCESQIVASIPSYTIGTCLYGEDYNALNFSAGGYVGITGPALQLFTDGDEFESGPYTAKSRRQLRTDWGFYEQFIWGEEHPFPPPQNTPFTISFVDRPPRLNGLLPLEFVSCFGSGARGQAKAPVVGPITSVELKSGGIGYAKRGRESPTVTLANETSCSLPAETTVTLTKASDKCEIDYWYVSGVAIDAPGGGYGNGEEVAFSVAAGDSEEVAATGTIAAGRVAPVLEASSPNGTGAVFSIEVESNDDSPETWKIKSVTASGAMTGYVDGDNLTFSGQCVTEEEAAKAVIVTNRSEPDLSMSVASASGTGAGLTAVLQKIETGCYGEPVPPFWIIASVTVDQPGSGYTVGDEVAVEGGTSLQNSGCYGTPASDDLYVSSVGVNGEILSVAVDQSNWYIESDGVIDYIELTGPYDTVALPGRYYTPGGLTSVTITDGGVYYRENTALPAYVADVQVNVLQPEDGYGSGALISATVEDDTSSADFGKIVALTLVDGGDNYADSKETACDNGLPQNPLP